MTFNLKIMPEAKAQLAELKKDAGLEKHLKAVSGALNKLRQNPRHPGLNSHPYDSLVGPSRESIWESYAENNTPCAYRIFWFYGPERGLISVTSIVAHPDDH